ncbi:MAG: hypothetical protein M3Y64_10685, partial [Gemmatimonadota bacterium]|nr:hypothetical protein [Gemmatimonadota bacterium]
MRATFIGPDSRPDFTPYKALEPTQSLLETNLEVGDISGPNAKERRAAATASARMNFNEPDAAPTEKLNLILWRDAMGWTSQYPEVRHSLFFPLAVDLSDDEREEREERAQKLLRKKH